MHTAWYTGLNIYRLDTCMCYKIILKCFGTLNKFKISNSGDKRGITGSGTSTPSGMGEDFKLSVIFSFLNCVVDTGGFIL